MILEIQVLARDKHKACGAVKPVNGILTLSSWGFGFGFMVFNATFNNISVISLRSVLLIEETGENHWPVTNHWQTLSHNVVSSTPCHERGSNSQL